MPGEIEDGVLIVLYQCAANQFWCGYSGGEEEAASEWRLLEKENPGLVEKGRFWAKEQICYVAAGA